jgi:hypothetical protein
MLAVGCATRTFDGSLGATEGTESEDDPTTDDPTFDDTGPTDDPTTDDPTDDTDDTAETDDTTGDGDGDTTGDGDGEPGCVGELPLGGICTDNCECMSSNCYVMPFLGGWCSECNEDADCDGGGCTAPNPFVNEGAHCNMGEFGAGCESDVVCMDGLQCSTALDLLGLIQINSCGDCLSDMDCTAPQICAPIVHIDEWTGINTCIDSKSLPNGSYCNLEGNGNEACESDICSAVDIMGLAQIGVCGECNSFMDCDGGECYLGEFMLETGELTGSFCM